MKGNEDLRGKRGKTNLGGGTGEKIGAEGGGGRERSWGQRTQGGKGGKDLNRERGGKDNNRGRGGKDLNRGRGQGVNSKGTQIRKQACNVGGLSRRR